MKWRNFLNKVSQKKIIILKNKILLLYLPSKDYNVIIRIDSFYKKYDNNYIIDVYKNYKENKILKNIEKIIFYRKKIYFKKLRFGGKGYYLYKDNRGTLAPKFGFAHRIYLWAQQSCAKLLSKTKVLFFSSSLYTVARFSQSLFFLRPLNVYTGRGVRFARSVRYKKLGKVSSYR